MATRYLVTAVEDCAKCGGTGYVLHPAWQALRNEQPGVLTDQQIRDFMDYFEGGEMPVPDEETVCFECGGSGTIERRVSLSQALAGSYRELEIRVDELEERLAVLEVDLNAPGITPAQYAAVRKYS